MLTRHCHQCGWEYAIAGLPGRSESCHQCGADLRVCLNCISYDARVAHQCRDSRTEPVADKHLAWKGKGEDKREAAARDKLKKLFGD